jgi:hypothetical protein
MLKPSALPRYTSAAAHCPDRLSGRLPQRSVKAREASPHIEYAPFESFVVLVERVIATKALDGVEDGVWYLRAADTLVRLLEGDRPSPPSWSSVSVRSVTLRPFAQAAYSSYVFAFDSRIASRQSCFE